MKCFEIRGRSTTHAIGEHEPVFLIAEIGKNFIRTEDERSVAEYLANAIALVRAAKESGADAVKFQTHNVEDEQADLAIDSPHFKGKDRRKWVTRNTESTPFETFWKPLKEACDEMGILFFSTPMSRGAAQKIAPLEPALWKVGSGDILDFVALDFLRQTGKPILISSGMSTLEEVDQAINFLREKNDQIVLLHCISRYPCPPEDLHLNTISFFRQRYDLPIGFSDHSITIESAIASAALGATVIEKHFSFDRGLFGADHKVSLTPSEFRTLADGVRRIQTDPVYREEVLSSEIVMRAMGTEEKLMDEAESVFRPIFRKSLIAAADLPEGTVLAPEHLYAMRPQAYLPGLPSEQYLLVLGKRLTRPIKRFDPISNDVLREG